MKILFKLGYIVLALGLIIAINIDIRSDSSNSAEFNFNESVDAEKVYGYDMEWVSIEGGCTYQRCAPADPEDWCLIEAQTLCEA